MTGHKQGLKDEVNLCDRLKTDPVVFGSVLHLDLRTSPEVKEQQYQVWATEPDPCVASSGPITQY